MLKLGPSERRCGVTVETDPSFHSETVLDSGYLRCDHVFAIMCVHQVAYALQQRSNENEKSETETERERGREGY
jgi:hypothetical protein